jgi:glutamate carboxypeptidase
MLSFLVLNIAHNACAKLSSEEEVLTTFIDENHVDQLNLLEKLVNINSGTENTEGVKKIGDLLKPEFEKLGFKTEWIDLPGDMKHAGSLVATHSVGAVKNRVLLIGHLDTVFPVDSPFQSFAISPDEKTATGPGVIDDKGGLVTILYAMKALAYSGKLKNANITIVLIGDEEYAAKPTTISRKALLDAAKNSDIALGFEFALSADELVTNRRGLSEWYLSSSGKSQHSSSIFESSVGFGAVYEVARVLNGIRTSLSSTSGLTINPGIILGGQTASESAQQGSGTATGQKTIIAAQALTHGDLRFLSNEQKSKAEDVMFHIASDALPNTTSKFTFIDIIPAMSETEGNKQLLEQFSNINGELGGASLRAVPAAKRGGADISYVSTYVSGSLDGLGPWGEGAHSQHETLAVASLALATKRAAIFISRYIHQ